MLSWQTEALPSCLSLPLICSGLHCCFSSVSISLTSTEVILTVLALFAWRCWALLVPIATLAAITPEFATNGRLAAPQCTGDYHGGILQLVPCFDIMPFLRGKVCVCHKALPSVMFREAFYHILLLNSWSKHYPDSLNGVCTYNMNSPIRIFYPAIIIFIYNLLVSLNLQILFGLWWLNL